jgi:flagellar basal-body rod protein FlgG
MRKVLMALSFSFPIHLFAGTLISAPIDPVKSQWPQGGLRVSKNHFDLAIQGNGFFVIQLEDGSWVYSRNGEMEFSPDGYLIQGESQGKIIGDCNGKLQPINLSHITNDDNFAPIKTLQTKLDGKIVATNENGHVQSTCTVVLALFRNPIQLSRDQHILRATVESGAPMVGMPTNDSRGSNYGYAIETFGE